ncbi:hypothetical protein E2320_020872 [Naja naja]|nr:hypothetical protein E2320_020872 [Naja naja]
MFLIVPKTSIKQSMSLGYPRSQIFFPLYHFSLKFAIDLGSQLHFVVPEEWKEIMKKLKVPLDKSRCYHPEYDGYCPGEPVKQADVVLLGFPLMDPMDPEVRRNDLEIYEPVTDPQGPAMTWVKADLEKNK